VGRVSVFIELLRSRNKGSGTCPIRHSSGTHIVAGTNNPIELFPEELPAERPIDLTKY
jgi:hypothetical protein